MAARAQRGPFFCNLDYYSRVHWRRWRQRDYCPLSFSGMAAHFKGVSTVRSLHPARRTRYIESFNARLRDELGEIFYTLREAQIVAESWRRHYNTIRPHASLGYKPPAPEVFIPALAAWPAALRR